MFSSKLEGNVLWLSMSLSDDKTYKFSYSTDGVHFTQIQEKFPLSRATWTRGKALPVVLFQKKIRTQRDIVIMSM